MHFGRGTQLEQKRALCSNTTQISARFSRNPLTRLSPKNCEVCRTIWSVTSSLGEIARGSGVDVQGIEVNGMALNKLPSLGCSGLCTWWGRGGSWCEGRWVPRLTSSAVVAGDSSLDSASSLVDPQCNRSLPRSSPDLADLSASPPGWAPSKVNLASDPPLLLLLLLFLLLFILLPILFCLYGCY